MTYRTFAANRSFTSAFGKPTHSNGSMTVQFVLSPQLCTTPKAANMTPHHGYSHIEYCISVSSCCLIRTKSYYLIKLKCWAAQYSARLPIELTPKVWSSFFSPN